MSTISHPKFGFPVNMEFHNIMDEVVEGISHHLFDKWYDSCCQHGTKINGINVHLTYRSAFGGKYISFTPIAVDINGNKVEYNMSNTIPYKQ
jgi:hypothetical protein